MSDPVAVAIITTLGAILVALLGSQQIKLRRIDRNAREAREQVANDHFDEDGKPINLRVESDERHSQNRRTLNVIMRLLGQGASTLATIQEDIAYLRRYGHENRQRIEEIEEHTQPRNQYAPPSGRHRREPT